MKQQDWVLVSAFTQASSRVVHEQCMTVVNRIAKLECKHCVCLRSTHTTYTIRPSDNAYEAGRWLKKPVMGSGVSRTLV